MDSGKPPSEEVIDLLRGYGITPDDEPEPGPDDEDGPAPSLGTGVMADVARHLDAAYRDLDLDLLGSLMHPEVHWTGVCSNSADVLDWYRCLVADGLRSTIESVEVDGDAVVLGSTSPVRPKGPGRRLPNGFTRYLPLKTRKSPRYAVIPTGPAHLLAPVDEQPRGALWLRCSLGF